ncbi:MAG: NAD(P)H-hydrate dehydratase [Candidatus Obscuribacterales bacterium]|nr:NAD(P)H-hydrate dehydratase [Candidatus Obscuribacterales bacterium]
MNHALQIPTTAELRELEAKWIEACHANWGLVLMELAGKRAAEIAREMWQKNKGDVVIFCGSGNNGGDGLVVARYFSMWEIPVSVFMVDGKQKASQNRSESLINKEALEKLGINIKKVSSDDVAAISQQVRNAGIIVDALLGTGLSRDVEGIYKQLVDLINECSDNNIPVLAIDIPSGVNSDNGQIMGSAVKATNTVTFGYLKSGLLLYPGADLAGKLSLIDIGLPEFHGQSKQWLTTIDHVRKLLPVRKADSHKGTFGSVLSIAGCTNYRGAATLASLTALRTGAGLSVLATAKSVIPEQNILEVIYKALKETDTGNIASDALDEVLLEIPKHTATIVGPGLGDHEETIAFVQNLLPFLEKPTIIDADGLNAIAKNTSLFPRNKKFVLTPHPKEFSRLTGLSTQEIHENRIESALKGAKEFDTVVVLKGAHSVIAAQTGEVFINPTGNSGMATAGAGDVLSGIIGGLLAQGLTPLDAAVAGTYIHGLAGDIAQSQIGEVGFLAGDIANAVPHALTSIHDVKFQGSSLEMSLSIN